MRVVFSRSQRSNCFFVVRIVCNVYVLMKSLGNKRTGNRSLHVTCIDLSNTSCRLFPYTSAAKYISFALPQHTHAHTPFPHVHKHTRTHLHTYTHLHIHLHLQTRSHRHTEVYGDTYIRLGTHKHTYTYTHTHTGIYNMSLNRSHEQHRLSRIIIVL